MTRKILIGLAVIVVLLIGVVLVMTKQATAPEPTPSVQTGQQ